MENLNNLFLNSKDEKYACESVDNDEKAIAGVVIKASFATNVGNVREHNEDNFYVEENVTRVSRNQLGKSAISTDEICIFAVCDGMGGESYGEEASRIAVEKLSYYSEKIKSASISELGYTINMYVNDANNEICEMAREKKCSRSGSTLALVCIENTTVYSFNIGDSRVYYFDGENLFQVTEDQTLAVKKMKANIYTEEEAKNSPDAHRITSFLGMENRGLGMTALAYQPIHLNENSAVLLCSDGLTDMCSDNEIKEILASSVENLSEALVNKALKNGGEDNVTCIVVRLYSKR